MCSSLIIICVDGFGTPLCLDQKTEVKGICHGKGMSFYVNKCYRISVTVSEILCSCDVELQPHSIHSIYPVNSHKYLYITVYPEANPATATSYVFVVVQKLPSIYLEILIMSPYKRLTSINVTCPPR